MAGFKDIKPFTPYPVPDRLIKGGINVGEGYAVKPPGWRLRRSDEKIFTQDDVGMSDIVPHKLLPGKVELVRVPESPTEISMGAEIELSVIDFAGRPVDLYGGGYYTRTNSHIEIVEGKPDWLLNTLKLSPEALRFEGELGTEAVYTFDGLKTEFVRILNKFIGLAEQSQVLGLFAGTVGTEVKRSISNIPPHEFLGAIHEKLRWSILDFDGMATQVHVGQEKFGNNADFTIYAGNIMNTLYSSMCYAIASAAPFSNGRITPYASIREAKRQKLATIGGVQDRVDLTGEEHLRFANSLLKKGEIPIPERAGSLLDTPGNGSHKDHRTKYSLGTSEFGPMDSSSNIDLWVAQAWMTRQLQYTLALAIKNGEPLPNIFTENTMTNKRHNRKQAALYGPKALLETPKGSISVTEAWDYMLDWLRPNDSQLMDEWEQVGEIIQKALQSHEGKGINTFDIFFNHGRRGNMSEMMREFATALPPDMPEDEKIRMTNVVLASTFARDVKKQASELGIF